MPKVRVCDASELPPLGRGRAFYVDAAPNPAASAQYRASLKEGRLRLAVFQVREGEFRLCEDRCPHMEAPLSKGRLEGDAIVCPLHFWKFDLASGACLLAAKCSLPVYKASIEEGALWAEIDAIDAPQS